MANAREHLEHAEHAGHHAHDPFDRRVAVTMAIIAACLAGVSTATHRKHNDVLRLVGEANRLRTEAAAAEVEKSNNFAWYQSKRNRQAQYEVATALAKMMPAGGDAETVAEWRKTIADYKPELKELQVKGAEFEKEAKELMEQSRAMLAESVHAHHQADRLDVAHLLAEVGLVVCSLAVLTKRKSFWLGGILATALALAAVASSYTIPHHDPAAGHASPGHAAPADGHGTGKH